jgi:hypothetical protein
MEGMGGMPGGMPDMPVNVPIDDPNADTEWSVAHPCPVALAFSLAPSSHVEICSGMSSSQDQE